LAAELGFLTGRQGLKIKSPGTSGDAVVGGGGAKSKGF